MRTHCESGKHEWTIDNIGTHSTREKSKFCKPCQSNRLKKWNEDNKDSVNEYHKNYRKNNMPKISKANNKCAIKRMKNWEGFIPIQTQCQVCGKDIFFNRGELKDRIHFDHRHGGVEPIKGCPTYWLKSHERTPASELIWKSCDFGYLCLCCNRSLPTQDRKLYVDNVYKYFYNTKET